jgi:hypothetical protein
VSICLALLTLRTGWRGGERRALAIAVVLMLVASPMVWMHYFALLLVPLALARPRLSRVWAVPLLMWVCPPTTHVHNWELVVGWLAAACLIYVVLQAGPVQRDRRRGGAAASGRDHVAGPAHISIEV